jgi:hypothetical protein
MRNGGVCNLHATYPQPGLIAAGSSRGHACKRLRLKRCGAVRYSVSAAAGLTCERPVANGGVGMARFCGEPCGRSSSVAGREAAGASVRSADRLARGPGARRADLDARRSHDRLRLTDWVERTEARAADGQRGFAPCRLERTVAADRSGCLPPSLALERTRRFHPARRCRVPGLGARTAASRMHGAPPPTFRSGLGGDWHQCAAR